MTIAEATTRSLVARLRAMMPPVSLGTSGAGPGLFTYCALERERIVDIRLDAPVVGIVLDGHKELWLGDEPAAVCPAGSAFVVPAGTTLAALNVPDERSGLYRSLVIDMQAARLPALARPPRLTMALRLALTPPLATALWHAAQAIADRPSKVAVRRARLDELAALVMDDPAGAWLAPAGTAARLTCLLATDPARRWTVDAAAAWLGMANATLRRQLAAEGQSFREILRAVRLDAAREVLAETGVSGRAAAAAGFASRGHFARLYRGRFGANPSDRAERADQDDRLDNGACAP